MRCNYIREKKYQCGDDYMAVGVFSITPQEHRSRGKKRKGSSEGQKAKNKMASLRRRQRKALTNFDRNGIFLTGTYEDPFLPEDVQACRKDVRNYERRVIAATCKRFGVQRQDIRMMLLACRKGENGRLHMHGFAQCPGLNPDERREWREMLEDLWRRRIPGSNDFEPLGTMNAERIDMNRVLGKSGEGNYGTVGYFYGHKERLWVETANLRSAIEKAPNDGRWSRKQLRAACSEMQGNIRWWEQRFPGWTLEKCIVLEPGGLHESPERGGTGWERLEPQCYVILRRRETAYQAAKVRT